MSKPLTLTDANFDNEVTQSELPVLVDFWASWCAPCRAVAPVIEELSEDFAGKVKIGKVDVDSNPEISTKFGIRSIPTLLIFKGGEVVDQIVGAVPKQEIASKLEAQTTAN